MPSAVLDVTVRTSAYECEVEAEHIIREVDPDVTCL